MDGGIALATVSPACDFSLAQPCAQVPAGSLSVDTRRLPDGPHTFSLVVTDAANNVQTVFSPSVVVDNSGPPAPMALTAAAAGPEAVAVAWRNPPKVPVAVVGARVQVCAASCAREVAVGPTGSARVAVPGPGSYTVRVWLIDAQGRGGPHNMASATVMVPAAASVGAGVRTRIAAVITGRRMRVSGSIARSGRVRVSWRSKEGRRSVGAGSRVVTIRKHRLVATFVLSALARRATTRVVIRAGRRIVAHARARHG
jgi:hypothetical protein